MDEMLYCNCTPIILPPGQFENLSSTSINLIHYRGPALFYILYGEDDFTAREALAEIKGALGDEVMLATNTTVFQGGTTTPEELAAACNTIPFLAANRLVIIEGLLGLFEPQGKGKTSLKPKDSGWFALKKCVEQMPARGRYRCLCPGPHNNRPDHVGLTCWWTASVGTVAPNRSAEYPLNR